MNEPNITNRWGEKIAAICQRFKAAVRAGETFQGLDDWLAQVPDSVRPGLEAELKRIRIALNAESIETRVLTSDAVLTNGEIVSGVDAESSPDGLSLLADCETLQGLSSTARESLLERFEEVSYPVGSRILRQGEQSQGLHLIASGGVDIVDVATGERIDCDGAGSVLGEMSLLMDKPCSAEVVATSEVRAYVLSTRDYQELRNQHAELEIALSQLVSDRLGGRRHDALCGKSIGGYQLKRCINRGGMGVVYEATDERSGGSVALKMLRHRFIYDDHIQGRFEQEARLLEQLKHPNIVSFREHFLAYRTRFLVLDLCNGADLSQTLRVRGQLDEATVRAILGQIASGLLYAHRAKVIHRDLKPGNVLVDRSGQVQLTDFGLSMLLNSDTELSDRKAVGTPSYMPPEQFRTEDVGPECDWYAVGCLACEMLRGRILFLPNRSRRLLETKRNCVPGADWPKIDASAELRDIVHGALQPDPKQRRLDLEKLATWARPVESLFHPIDRPDLEAPQD